MIKAQGRGSSERLFPASGAFFVPARRTWDFGLRGIRKGQPGSSLLTERMERMSTDRYQSPLSERYASKEMQYIFSPDKKFRTWRKLWIALAETEKS